MPNRIPNPNSPAEVRQAIQRLVNTTEVLTGVITSGAVGEILIGAGDGVTPVWGTELTALTILTVDNITIDGATITSDTDAISFGNESLTTTGTIAGINVTSGADPGHTHTGASLGSIDISDDTNLAVTAPIVLTDDTLSLAQIDISADTNLAVTAPIVLTDDTLSLDQTGIDHGTIGGLGDDDHTDYHTDGRAATWLAANHETTYNHANYNTAYNWVNANDGVLLTHSSLTSGRVVLVGASGVLTDSASFLHDGNGFFCTTFKVGQDANNVLELVGVLYGGTPSPSYDNEGGTGDRTGIITVSFSGTTSADVTDLVDGTQDSEFWWYGQTAGGLYLRFDFGEDEEKVITEAKWYQSSSPTHGDWKWQGSANASDWTDIGSSFTLGGVEQTQTELSGNADGYRYYQLLGVSGSTDFNPYLREIEFKIDDMNPVGTDYAPGLQAYKTDGETVQWLCLQPEGGNVSIERESPTARLHLPAGTTAASTAPLKLTTGTSLTTAEAGALEFTTDNLFFTITTGAVRKEIALTEGLTSGRVPYATTNGRLTDAAGLAWDGSLLTATGFSGGGVTTGVDPGHTHTLSSISEIDISADTNLTVSSPITLTDDDIGLDETAVDHDNLLNFVANEHINHIGVTLTAGSGLSGGGDISTNRTFDLDINSLDVATIAAGDFIPFWDITATATNKKITFANLEGTLNHDNLNGFVANEHIDWTSAGDNLSTSGSITTSTLTSGRVVLAGASGILEDHADLTFNGTTLGTGSLTLPATTSLTVGVIRQGAVALIHTYNHATAVGDNVFIGKDCGNFTSSPGGGAATLASRNLAMGSLALPLITTGFENVAIGTYALRFNTTGALNVALGSLALYTNVSGIYNIGIGSNTLLNSTGNYNIGIGGDAGYICTGSGNTFIGARSGRWNDAHNNVFIGYLAGHYETASDKLFIDRGERVNEATARTTSLIYGVFAATPVAQDLVVNGQLGLNITPTAWVTLPAGSMTAGTAPLKFTSGALTTVAVTGQLEFLTDKIHFVITTGAARKEIALTEGLTSGRVPFATTNGRLTDAAGLTWNGNLTLSKASGGGIKVDNTTPTFPWRDLTGAIVIKTTGVGRPVFVTYKGNIEEYQFAINDKAEFTYHIPHDYVPGSDIHLHVHWSHISVAVTGGTITFGYELTYAKGHNQAPFGANKIGTIVGTASATQYQHIVSEIQISATSPSGSQIDSDDLEPDGVILIELFLNANNMTGATPDPFVHEMDVHYQSTNIGTKANVPDFYV